MKITQEYMDNEVIEPLMKRLDDLERLIKSNDKSTKLKISWMSDNIARIPKKKK